MCAMSVEEQLKKKVETIVNLLNSSNFDEVIKKTIPLIKKFPDEYIFNNLLALAYNALGKHESALETLTIGLQLNPNNIFLLNNHGLVLTNLGNFDKAEKSIERALKNSPFFLDASISLATLKLRKNQANEAVKILNRIFDKYQHNYVLNFALGDAYQQSGSFEKARLHYEYCLNVNPENCAPDKAISLTNKYNEKDPHLKQMQSKFEKIKSKDNKMLLCFSLGKAYEDIKDFDHSFKFIKKGNQLRAESIPYNLSEDKKLFENIKNLFSNKTIKSTVVSNKQIIFIVGMTRSGTSLLEQILSSHEKVYGAGELNLVPRFIKKNFMKNKTEFNGNSSEDLEVEKFREMQNNYLENIGNYDFDENIIVDKAPLNFRWIGFLIKAFPNCKIIHSKRNSMDTCWSNYKNFFPAKALNFSYSFKSLGGFYLLYEDLMKHWDNTFGNRIYKINYEDLIKNQKEEIKNLLNYCDLEWDENCMSFYKNKKSVSTASLAQVRNPMYKSSMAQWENYSEKLKELSSILNT